MNFKTWLENKNSKNTNEINWIKPNIQEEINEFTRTAKHLELDLKKLIQSTKNAFLIPLDIQTWETIRNTDSYKTTNIKQAIQLAKVYNKDINDIIDGFKKKENIPAPIVLFQNNKKPYLIAGNTRLMVSRAYNVQPKILRVDLN